MTITLHPLATAAAVGLLSGTHAAIWGMYKDAAHEGFSAARFARSPAVGAAAAAAIQWALALPVPEPAALVVLFGLAYAAERGVVEVWKTFVRDEDQAKYTIPMQFTLLGTPVASRGARAAAGAAYVAVVAVGLTAVARLDGGAPPAPYRVALVGLAAGAIVAVGGAWKDAPTEGFEPLKFFRSPGVTAALALALSRLTGSHLLAVAAAVGFERAVSETYKTFFFPSVPRGKFAGKPVVDPGMLTRRRRFVPTYVAIWAAVLAAWGVALGAPPRGAASRGAARGAPAASAGAAWAGDRS
jgi:hypothetical protein